jgi:hypothetical protein
MRSHAGMRQHLGKQPGQHLSEIILNNSTVANDVEQHAHLAELSTVTLLTSVQDNS